MIAIPLIEEREEEEIRVRSIYELMMSDSEASKNICDLLMSDSSSPSADNTIPNTIPSVVDYRSSRPIHFRGLYRSDILDELSYHMGVMNPSFTVKHCYKLVNRYYRNVLEEIAVAASFHSLSRDVFSFRKWQCSTNVGRFTHNGCGQTSLLGYCLSSHKLRVIDIVMEGFRYSNHGMYSQVKLSPYYRNRVLVDLIHMSSDIESKAFNFNSSPIKYPTNRTDVDHIALTKLREDSIQLLLDDKSGDPFLTTSAWSNAYGCSKILNSGLHIRGTQRVLWEKYRMVSSGRMYGHGVCLQTVSKPTRLAALSPCVEYDLVANSFACCASMAHKINPQLKITNMIYFIKNRNQVREQIADEIGCSVSDIKQIFTSMGFGSLVSNHEKSSARQTLGVGKLRMLLANTLFCNIRKELKLINKTLLSHYDGWKFEGYMGRKYNDIKNPDKTFRKKLAWIYQNAEAYMMGMFIDEVRKHTGQNPLLLVHDGVYYKEVISQPVLDLAVKVITKEFRYAAVDETIHY